MKSEAAVNNASFCIIRHKTGIKSDKIDQYHTLWVNSGWGGNWGGTNNRRWSAEASCWRGQKQANWSTNVTKEVITMAQMKKEIISTCALNSEQWNALSGEWWWEMLRELQQCPVPVKDKAACGGASHPWQCRALVVKSSQGWSRSAHADLAANYHGEHLDGVMVLSRFERFTTKLCRHRKLWSTRLDGDAHGGPLTCR